VSKPTIREILTDFDITDPKHELLAERVEKVLALVEPISRDAVPSAGLAKSIMRALDGE